jgi:hypothetical protein
MEQIARDMRERTFPKKSEQTQREEAQAVGAAQGSLTVGEFSLRWAVETVLKTFRADEAQGYRSRDRQYAIDILGKALEQATSLPSTDQGGGT